MSRSLTVLLIVLVLSGCATTRPQTAPEIPARHTMAEFRDQPFAYVYDPWEGFNRNMYRFNFYFDKYLYLPVVRGYEYVTPVFVQQRVSHFFDNIGELKNLTNSVFQLKGKEAGISLGRFLTNSTLGLGGLFDPASKWGLERRPEDFGKTLGYWGVASGPYLVLPIFGPSSARDTGGMAVDSGIRYGMYTVAEAPVDSDDSFAVTLGIETLEAIDARHQQTFRYYESGFPFEYYLVRFIYHEKRELEATKQPPPSSK
ncbi:VacJ family lipoprotein [Geomonas sp. Red276]